jgi:transcriptional regulator with XRE-family HTH domain
MKDKGFERLMDQLGEEIKESRLSAGLSQEALAHVARVDRTYVSQLERGVANPSLKILYRIFKVLETELCITLLERSLD